MTRSKVQIRIKPTQVGPIVIEREFPIPLVVWVDTSIILTWIKVLDRKVSDSRLEPTFQGSPTRLLRISPSS